MANAFPHGTVHEAGEDLQAAVRSKTKVLELWEGLTPELPKLLNNKFYPCAIGHLLQCR